MALIDFYLTDIINIISYAKGADQVSIRTEILNIQANITDKNQVVTNNKGEEVIGNTFIMVSPDQIANVKYYNKVQIVKKLGSDYQDKTKEYLIKAIANPGGFDRDMGYIGIWI
jgi:dihydroxyacetone kinase